jgi:hypothetical protein
VWGIAVGHSGRSQTTQKAMRMFPENCEPLQEIEPFEFVSDANTIFSLRTTTRRAERGPNGCAATF